MGCDRLPFVFLHKNWLQLRFNYRALAVILIGCCGVIFAYLKSTYHVYEPIGQEYDGKNYEILRQNYFPSNDYDSIYYAPTTSNVDSFMEEVRQALEITQDRYNAFDSAAEMRLVMEQKCIGTCFAIEFQQLPERGVHNGQLNYAISSNKLHISPKKRYVNDDDINGNKDDDDYIRVGFLTLQTTIDKQYLLWQHVNKDFDVAMYSMPTIDLKHMDNARLLFFGTLFSILLSVLLLSTFLVPLVEEKQDGLKEFLTLATPMSFLNGLTFSFIRFILYLCFLIVMLLAAHSYAALGLAPFAYMFLLFLLYIVAAMSYTYMISVCFNSVFYAKVGGLLLLVIPYIFYLLRGGVSCVAFYLLNTKTFMEGLDVLQTFTNKHHKFTASDLFVEIKDNSFSLFSVYLLLILQTIGYALLYNYLSYVFPGPGGLKRSYLFFLNPAFYRKRQRNETLTGTHSKEAIIIQDLVKRFKRSDKQELIISDRLNMNIKNKQITVLLGHNGAGKTTTLNMIMGLEPKDSGKITVCSERDVASYRHLIGFCPQHSIFMNYMTCQQHFVFFAQLRCMNEVEAYKLAEILLKQLKLEEKFNEYGKNLSGGMKRRLSLGIALAGETKIVVLDEPSSGLDIESRRELWDILLELRKTKAVLVTTHYMEEAETLGDTICILANGRLQRSGTPLELKRRSGSGYRLKLCTYDIERYMAQETLQQIQQYVPNAKVLNMVPPTVYINLPYEYKSKYHDMLLKLEAAREQLGIASISISDTSLEDVFLNCAAEIDEIDSPDCSRIEMTNIPYKPLNSTENVACMQQLRAIAYKKLTFLRNEWLYTLIMLCIPFACTAFAIFLMHAMAVHVNEDVLPLKLSHMREGVVYVYNPTTQHANIEQLLLQQIASYKGIRAQKLELHGDNTLVQELRALQKQNLYDFLQHIIGVIDLSQTSSNGGLQFSIYNSGNIYHSSVILQNLVDSTMLKSAHAEADIMATYVPIRRFITDVSPTRLEYYAVLVSIGMFFSMFYYVSLPFREHSNGFKQLQAMPRHVYWFSMLLCDLTLHLFICIALYMVQRAVMPRELYNAEEQFVIIASIFFYGLSYLPILYCFANSFKSISTISTYLLFMLIVSAIVPLITSSNLQAMKNHIVEIEFLSLLPDFNLNHQLRLINENFIINRRNAASLKNAMTDSTRKLHSVVAAQNELSLNMFFIEAIFVCIVSLMILIYIVEHKYKRQSLWNLLTCRSLRLNTKKNAASPTPEQEQEIQCSEEKEQVEQILKNNTESEYPLIVSTLQKKYNRKHAVRDLSFAVKKGECFGLLGVNGAGKTTTFQMIGTNVTITDGTIKINGKDIRDNEIQYRYSFGYCPQYDSLNNFMTAEQSLNFMAMLRGLSNKDLNNEVIYWLEKMDLMKYRYVQVRHYSGGTKRKLLAALAMIGSPKLVLLDEPTTGVDPVSRRFLWKCIQDFQKHDKTIVLTSHSMDECEQLCNRLAIMADGIFKCLGGICELKLRYGSGFTIKVKMRDGEDSEEHVRQLSQLLHGHFPESELREHHSAMLTYFVRHVSPILWSSVFKRTEQFLYDVTENIGELIEDYSVNESTLEDIFLKFDKRKQEERQQISNMNMSLVEV